MYMYVCVLVRSDKAERNEHVSVWGALGRVAREWHSVEKAPNVLGGIFVCRYV